MTIIDKNVPYLCHICSIVLELFFVKMGHCYVRVLDVAILLIVISDKISRRKSDEGGE